VQYDDEIKTNTREICHTAQQQSEGNVSSSSMITMIHMKHLFNKKFSTADDAIIHSHIHIHILLHAALC